MSVIHVYSDSGKIVCTSKQPFMGKEKTLDSLPPLWALFSKKISCVVFKFPSLLRTGSIRVTCFALLSFLLGKYYKQKIPKLLNSFLDRYDEKNIFFIGGAVGAELIKFHYANQEDVIVEGVETINLIAKKNKELSIMLYKVKPSNVRKKIFIVGLFSPELLILLKKKYPCAEIELRYFDLLRQNRLSEFKQIRDYAQSNSIKLSVYDHATSSRFNVPYEINKVNVNKLANYQNLQKQYDVCFLAGYSPEREKAIRPLLRSLKKAKLNVKLLIVNYKAPELEGYLVDKHIMPYEEYLNLIGTSRAVIDLWRLDTNEGYSFRISEAFALRTKIITNRQGITCEPFYDSSRIFVFQEENEVDPEEIKRFLFSSLKSVDDSIFDIGSI